MNDQQNPNHDMQVKSNEVEQSQLEQLNQSSKSSPCTDGDHLCGDLHKVENGAVVPPAIEEQLTASTIAMPQEQQQDFNHANSDIHEKKKNVKSTAKIKESLAKIEWKPMLFLVIAGLINSLGVGLLLVPNGVIDGGFSGLSYLLGLASGWPISIFLIVLNIPIYIFAFKKLGKNFIVYSLVAIIAYSVFMYLIQEVFMLCGPNNQTSPITTIPVLSCIFGGLLSGVGSGLTIRCGGSLDGVEVMAVYFTKKVNISVGQLVMFFNIIMYIIAGFFVGFDYPLYSIIAYAVGSKTVDGIVEGLDKAKAVMIITNMGQDVAKSISEIMGRGITMIKGEGYYSKGEKSIIYYVVNRFEIGKIKKIILQVDHNAFVSITDVSEVVGRTIKKRSFSKPNKQ